MQRIDAARTNAPSNEHAAVHIDRVIAAVNCYNIKSPKHVTNVEESGVSLKNVMKLLSVWCWSTCFLICAHCS